MALSLHTRGADAGGFFIQQGLAFGHRRLSILDLSPNSQQPMIDSELGLGIVFNGCIYNFREMRRELRKHASGRVMLVRDRLGIKPLFYTETANSLRHCRHWVAGGGLDIALASRDQCSWW